MLSPTPVIDTPSSHDREEEYSFKSIFNLVYRDQFEKAYEKLDAWSVEEIQHRSTHFKDPSKNNSKDGRIFNLMKMVQYCLISVPFSTIQKLAPGEESYQFWKKEWSLFEEFVKTQSIYYEANYLGFKNYFYQKMIDHLILEFNSQSQYSPIMLETCKRLMEVGSWDKAEEGFHYLIKKSPKLIPEVELQLIELYHYREKNLEALHILKNLLFNHPQVDLFALPLPEVKDLIRELFLDGLKPQEIKTWLGVFLRIKKVLPVFYSLESETYKRAVILVHETEKSEPGNSETHHAILIYRYLYLMDQLYTRIVKGKTYLQDDLDNYLKKLKQINFFIYQQVQSHYETR